MKQLWTFILIGILFFTKPLTAQIWTTVGNGITENVGFQMDIPSFQFNNNIYIAYSVRKGTNQFDTYVKRWNGLIWQYYPIINNFIVSDIFVDNNGIYVSGEVSSALPKNVAFYEFDGNSWIAQAPAGFLGETKTITKNNGNIIVGGIFNTGSGNPHIFSWDGSVYSFFPAFGNGQLGVNHIKEFNGEMHVCGASSPSTQVSGIFKWDGTSWISLASKFKGIPGPNFPNEFVHMFTFQGDLYSSVNTQLFKIRNDSAFFIDNIIRGLFASLENNGIMYLGDTMAMSTFDGATVTNLSNAPSSTGLELYNGELFAFGQNDFFQNKLLTENAFKTSANNGVFQGKTFYDATGNCRYNPGEKPIRDVLVDLGSNLTAVSNKRGDFNLLVPPGSYNLIHHAGLSPANKNLSVICPNPPPFSISAGQLLVEDIPFYTTVQNDLILGITGYSGWRSRQGFDETYQISVTNAGNISHNNTRIDIEIPPTLSFISCSPSPSNQVNNIITVYVGHLIPRETKIIKLVANTNLATNPIGSKLMFQTYFTSPVIGDSDISDNRDTLLTTVVGSYDPNDKTPSETQIPPGTTEIDYHIRFQNTGTDTAYGVSVIDSLELNIPITSVIINSASHNYNLRVVGNVLIWEFDNILLPDSTTDFEGSQGFVNFSTSINPNLLVGDTVQNQVQIYFDYQAPIFTNKAKTAVVEPISTAEEMGIETFEVYPNPANDILFLENYLIINNQVQVINSEGRLIRTIDIEAFGTSQINIQKLEPGLYILVSGDSKFKLVVQ